MININKTQIPSSTLEFIQLLELEFEDFYETNEKEVGTPEYWKKAGIIELIRRVKTVIGDKND